MKKRKETRLYNILLPVWLIIFLPSWLWLVLIPANYVIDRLVLKWGIKELPDAGDFCRKNNWKICLAGFLGDFVGCAILFAGTYLFNANDGPIYDIFYGVSFNPFHNIWAFLIVALSVAVSGLVIFILDRKILTKAGLTEDLARSAALKIAIITAPYLYFFPSGLLYN